MAAQQLICRTCETQFVHYRKKAYCSETCRPSYAAPLPGKTICKACQAPFDTPTGRRPPTKYCLSCKPLVRAQQVEAIGRKRTKQKWAASQCEGCAKAGMQTVKGLCRPCAKVSRKAMLLDQERQREGRTHLPPSLVEGKLVDCVCAECQSWFSYIETPQYRNGQQRKFCCTDCQRRNWGRRKTSIRRARMGGVKVEDIDPIAVFIRDGWKCQICGRKTPRKHRGKHTPNAPEMDHIVALANGGAHTWANVQCACRACNSRKGASDYGQLHLFAS